MALVRGLAEHVGGPGGDPLRRIRRHAERLRNFIRRQKADAKDVAGQPVGVLAHHVDGVVAVGFYRFW